MRVPRKFAAPVLVIGLTAATLPGVAATLGGLTPRKLGADSGVVSACDSDGFSVSYTNSGGTITSVDVSGIADPGCEGGQLSVVLANASGTSSAATASPSSGWPSAPMPPWWPPVVGTRQSGSGTPNPASSGLFSAATPAIRWPWRSPPMAPC